MAAGVTIFNCWGEALRFDFWEDFEKWWNTESPHGQYYGLDKLEWEGVYGAKELHLYSVYDTVAQRPFHFTDRSEMEEFVRNSSHPIQTSENSTYYELKDEQGNMITSCNNLNDIFSNPNYSDDCKVYAYSNSTKDTPTPLSLNVDDYENLGEFFTSTEPYYDEAGNLIATPSPDTGDNESEDGTPSADKGTDSLTPGGETPDSVDPSTGSSSSDNKEDSQPESSSGSAGNSGSGNDSSNPTGGSTDSGSSDTSVEDNNTGSTDSGSTDDSSDGGDFSSGDNSSSSDSGESSSGSDNGGDVSSSPESTDSSTDSSPAQQAPAE